MALETENQIEVTLAVSVTLNCLTNCSLKDEESRSQPCWSWN